MAVPKKLLNIQDIKLTVYTGLLLWQIKIKNWTF